MTVLNAIEQLSDVVKPVHALQTMVFCDQGYKITKLILIYDTFFNTVSSVVVQQPRSTKKKLTVKIHQMMLTL